MGFLTRFLRWLSASLDPDGNDDNSSNESETDESVEGSSSSSPSPNEGGAEKTERNPSITDELETHDRNEDTENAGTENDQSITDESESEHQIERLESNTKQRFRSDETDRREKQGSHSNSNSSTEPTFGREDISVKTGTRSNQPQVASSEFAELTGFQRDLLIIISGMESPKGLEVKEELEKYYDDEINHGRLYPNLDTLVEKDLVEKISLSGRSNGYNITQTGKAHLKARKEWTTH